MDPSPTNLNQDPINSVPSSNLNHFLQKLSPKQKLSLLSLVLVVIVLPLVYFASTLETRLNPRAYLPATPPTSITPIPSSTAPYPTRIPTPLPSSTAPYPTRIPTPIPSSTAYITPTPISCNLTINPPKTCPTGYQCVTTNPKLGADGKCIIAPTPSPTAKPTYIPTPTPTWRPTYTPTPTARPSYPPTPTPTLISNIKPVIKTTSLGTVYFPFNYSGTVTGYDQNTNDSLTMKITNLPPNLSQGACTTSISNNLKNISCRVSGQVRQPGTYSIKVTLSDNKGGITEKTLNLTVKLWYQLFQTP